MAVGNSLAVQWLGLHAFTAEAAGSIPGRGTKIPQAVQHGQKKEEEEENGGNNNGAAEMDREYIV